jgi:hypothetical protein
MSIIVKSKDGVEFAVETARGDWKTVVAERRFALTRTARELESFGDYHRLDPLGGYVVVRAPVPLRGERHALQLQAERAAFRVKLRLIQGGKS